jgi:hypothetical protein
MPPKSAGVMTVKVGVDMAKGTDWTVYMGREIEAFFWTAAGPLVRGANARLVARVQANPPALVLEFGQRKGAAWDAFCRALAGAEERERCSDRPRYITHWDVEELAEAAWRATR